MSLSTSILSKFFLLVFVGSIAFLAYSFDLINLVDLEEKQEINILDQETHATILAVRHEQKSELLKGSILDYEGIYVTYEFEVDNQVYRKTEVLKKSEGSLTKMLSSLDLNEESNKKVVVRYSSKDPRKSVIELSNGLASF